MKLVWVTAEYVATKEVCQGARLGLLKLLLLLEGRNDFGLLCTTTACDFALDNICKACCRETATYDAEEALNSVV